MADTTFTNGVTVTDADWFNDLNRLHYTIFSDPADLTAVKTSVLASPVAIGSGTPAAGTFTNLTATGNASVTGTLGVTGAATLPSITGATTFANQPVMSSLTASRAVFTDGSKGLVSNAITGTGNVVMSASPTLTGTTAAANLDVSGALEVDGAVTVNNNTFLMQGSGNLTAIFDAPTSAYVAAQANGSLATISSGTNAALVLESVNDSYVRFFSVLGGHNGWCLGADASVSGEPLVISANTTSLGTNNVLIIDTDKNVVIGAAQLANSATDGFLYIPGTTSGAPSGVPTSYSGRHPMVVDDTNNRLYINIGGTWRYATLT